jgi:N-acetylmuramoyl-L-alanine amidase
VPAAPLVGLQVGHWRIEEHPAEQARLRAFSGAYCCGAIDEWVVNMDIAERVRTRLEDAGMRVELLPSTVPPGYRADVFVSIHADGDRTEHMLRRRGYKVAAPFIASPAAQDLAASVETSYVAATGLPPDPRGITYSMRAYYAFAAYRYEHAISLDTPAVLIECAFMTHPDDRVLLFDQPDRIADGIADGILQYLAGTDDAAADYTLAPPRNWLRADGEVLLRRSPDAASTPQRALPAGEEMVVLTETEDWYLVHVRSDWEIGWLRKSEVVDTGQPALR